MTGTSLVVQRLRLHTHNAEGLGWIPGQGKIPDAATKGSPATAKDPLCRKED